MSWLKNSRWPLIVLLLMASALCIVGRAMLDARAAKIQRDQMLQYYLISPPRIPRSELCSLTIDTTCNSAIQYKL